MGRYRGYRLTELVVQGFLKADVMSASEDLEGAGSARHHGTIGVTPTTLKYNKRSLARSTMTRSSP